MRQVVVTGMGIVSPVGSSVDESWQSVVSGESGIRPISCFDASDFPVRIAGEVKHFDPSKYISVKDARKIDRFIQFAIAASSQAVEQAGIDFSVHKAERCGVFIGSGIGGLETIAKNNEQLLKHGVKRVSPFFVPGGIINMASGYVSMRYGLQGPNIGVATACTSGLHSIGLGASMIASGIADVMIVGGAEAAVTPLGVAGFSASRALSMRDTLPEQASCPWDEKRDGFVLSEGAGALVLEAAEFAEARSATALAEIVGFGLSGDAHHMTSPPENGEGAAVAMSNALRHANLTNNDIQYINAHGTSTKAGDVAECRAIEHVFDGSVLPLVSSTKSMTGHLIGAAGSVETIFCIKSLQDQLVPPTINLTHLDMQTDIDFVPLEARKACLDYVMCNSFGFGGTNASLIIKKLQ